MTSTTTQKTLGCLRELFASYGCPELFVSDNGPQFNSAEFLSFLSSNGVRHVKSPPYHPQSNGVAERCVQTFKGAMKSMKDEPGDISTRLLQLLFQYRCTPHATTGTSPAQLFLGRTLRTRLSMLHRDLAERVRVKQEKQQNSGPLAQRVFEKEISKLRLSRSMGERRNHREARRSRLRRSGWRQSLAPSRKSDSSRSRFFRCPGAAKC